MHSAARSHLARLMLTGCLCLVVGCQVCTQPLSSHCTDCDTLDEYRDACAYSVAPATAYEVQCGVYTKVWSTAGLAFFDGDGAMVTISNCSDAGYPYCGGTARCYRFGPEIECEEDGARVFFCREEQ